MGCFNYTCAVSNLPIVAGCPVKYMLLVESPYGEPNPCTAVENYWICAPPISAEYNEYGSIENYDENSPELKTILKMFEENVVEKSIGANKYHDPAVEKGMSFENWLEAIWERRVQFYKKSFKEELKGKYGDDTEEKLKDFGMSKPDGQPYIHEIIKDFLHIEGLNISEPSLGMVVLEGYTKNNDWIDEAKEKYKDIYQVVETASGGTCPRVLILPKPNDKDSHRILLFRGYTEEKVFNVYQTMIRKDVWDYLSEKIDKSTYENFDKAVIISDLNKYFKSEDVYEFFISPDGISKYSIVKDILSSCSLNQDFLRKSFKTFKKLNLSEEENNKFIESFAETIIFQLNLHDIRRVLMPGQTAGPQWGIEKFQVNYNKFIAKLGTAQLKGQK